MFENITSFLKKIGKKDTGKIPNSKETAKERLHLVLMQDRANVSVDFLELMKQEIIDVIKKYIQIDENAIDVRLTNKENSDGSNGAPALYANIPIVNLKNEEIKEVKEQIKKENEEKSVNKDSKESRKEKSADPEKKRTKVKKAEKSTTAKKLKKDTEKSKSKTATKKEQVKK